MRITALYTILLIAGLAACSRETEAPEIAGVYTTGETDPQSCIEIWESSGGGVVMLSMVSRSNTVSDLVVTSFTEAGLKDWEKIYKDAGQYYYTSKHKDGTISLISGQKSDFIRMNRDGEILFRKGFNNGAPDIYSQPLIGEDGAFYTTLNKGAAWIADTSRVIRFDASGNADPSGSFTTNDFKMGGLLNTNVLYRKTGGDVYYYYGTMYPVPVNLLGNAHFFTAMVRYSGRLPVYTKVKIHDASNLFNMNQFNHRHVLTDDSSLLVAITRQAPGDVYEGHVFKISAGGDLVWEKDLKVAQGGTNTRFITLCRDGNILIGGDCIPGGKGMKQPFAVLMDAGGNILWSRVYDTTLEAQFDAGFQHSDGSFYFGGQTSGFGSGLNSHRVLLMKKDGQGL